MSAGQPDFVLFQVSNSLSRLWPTGSYFSLRLFANEVVEWCVWQQKRRGLTYCLCCNLGFFLSLGSDEFDDWMEGHSSDFGF